MATSTYVSASTKLGMHHFAYLRAVAEGVDQREAGSLYLGHDPRDGAVALRKAHLAIVDRVRAIAKRSGDRRWRLIGLQIRSAAGGDQPSLEQWAEEKGLEDFGQAELLELYAEAFPSDRKSQRNGRLRTKQLELIRSLATTAAEPARPQDRLDAWLPDHIAASLMASGMLMLADLQAHIQAGGNWWRTVPKIGRGKAERLANHLEVLLPGSTISRRSGALAHAGSKLAQTIGRPHIDPRSGALQGGVEPFNTPRSAPPDGGNHPGDVRYITPLLGPSDGGAQSGVVSNNTLESGPSDGGTHQGVEPFNPIQRTPSEVGFILSPQQLASRDLNADAEAVRAWIRAKAGAEATAKIYRRELSRFLLFCQQRGITLTTCNADDCMSFMALLAHVPPNWIGGAQAPIGADGWAPFAGQLSTKSQRQAVKVVGACFAWLVAARYLPGNPWILVNRKTGDDRDTDELASRAIDPDTWTQIVSGLEAEALTEAGAERALFVLNFIQATGLRAAELLGAQLKDFRMLDSGRMVLQVYGKGSKNRVVPVPGQARRAVDRYLSHRGIALDDAPEQPLLTSTVRPGEGISYVGLYKSLKAWMRRAIDASDLSFAAKVEASRASTHWLRHTCATRALEGGAPLDVVGQLLGHADPRTTAKYTRAQLRRVADEMEKVFG